MASSIVMVSVIDAWKERTTVDAIKAVQAKIEAVAQSLDGVILLRFGNDEANRRNSVSEVYKDADAFKAFLNEGLKGRRPPVRAFRTRRPGSRDRPLPGTTGGAGQARRRSRNVQGHAVRRGALLHLLS